MSAQPEALRLAHMCDAEVVATVERDILMQDTATELRRLHSENKSLRATLSAPRHGEWDRLLELKAEIEELRQDADRYRWLRNHALAAGHGSITVFLDDRRNGVMQRSLYLESMDAAIDLAMEAQHHHPVSPEMEASVTQALKGETK